MTTEIVLAIAALQAAKRYIAENCIGMESDKLLIQIISAAVDIENELKKVTESD